MGESTPAAYAANLAFYEKVLAAVPGVERKGDKVPYASHNGHMFTYLSKAGVMALRLPEKDREAFLKKYAARLCMQYGVVQKEYVDVPDSLLRNLEKLAKYLKASFFSPSKIKPKTPGKKKAATRDELVEYTLPKESGNGRQSASRV